MPTAPDRIIAVALNPAIDRVIEVPHLAIGAHQVARLLTRNPAGKAVNLAKGLALLGVPSILTGLVGEGEIDYYARDAAAYGIPMQMLPVTGHTRENITLIDPVGRTETHLRDRGFVVRPDELGNLRRRLIELAGPDATFVFGGALPQGITPEEVADLLKICRGTGSRLAVDASGPALSAAVDIRPWLIKPNRQEFQDLLGRNLPTTADLLAAGKDLAHRIDLTLLSCGEDGAYLFAADAAWHGRCDVPAHRIASTVGCGDALLAGLLASLHRGLDLPGALKLAVAAAAATALSPTALFDRENVDAMLPLAEVFAS